MENGDLSCEKANKDAFNYQQYKNIIKFLHTL